MRFVRNVSERQETPLSFAAGQAAPNAFPSVLALPTHHRTVRQANPIPFHWTKPTSLPYQTATGLCLGTHCESSHLCCTALEENTDLPHRYGHPPYRQGAYNHLPESGRALLKSSHKLSQPVLPGLANPWTYAHPLKLPCSVFSPSKSALSNPPFWGSSASAPKSSRQSALINSLSRLSLRSFQKVLFVGCMRIVAGRTWHIGALVRLLRHYPLFIVAVEADISRRASQEERVRSRMRVMADNAPSRGKRAMHPLPVEVHLMAPVAELLNGNDEAGPPGLVAGSAHLGFIWSVLGPREHRRLRLLPFHRRRLLLFRPRGGNAVKEKAEHLVLSLCLAAAKQGHHRACSKECTRRSHLLTNALSTKKT